MFSQSDVKDILESFATKQEQGKEEFSKIPKITQFSSEPQFGDPGLHK